MGSWALNLLSPEAMKYGARSPSAKLTRSKLTIAGISGGLGGAIGRCVGIGVEVTVTVETTVGV
ncbi:hypothetical protein TUMEXPCC7403_14760 [Tumidithrix helvetica PCC 7403]